VFIVLINCIVNLLKPIELLLQFDLIFHPTTNTLVVHIYFTLGKLCITHPWLYGSTHLLYTRKTLYYSSLAVW